MMPYLNIGGLALPLAPLTLLVGVWIGLTLIERYAHVYQVDGDKLYNLVFYSMVAGIIGARLTFAAGHPQAFLDAPLSLFSANPGLLDLQGGFVIGLLAALILGQRWHLPLWPSMDGITAGLALFMLALPISQLASGQAYGAVTDLPWAVQLWGASRHPVQLYQSAAAAMILWLVWPTRHKAGGQAGLNFLRFLAYSAAARLFLEAFRGDSMVVLNGIRVVQVAAWLVLAAALVGISRLRIQSSN